MPLGKSEKQEREMMRESKSKGKEKQGRGNGGGSMRRRERQGCARCFRPNVKHCVTFFLGKSSDNSGF